MPWLYRMTVNACHDVHRKRLWTDLLAGEEVDPASVGGDFTAEMTRVEQKQMVAAALKSLTERERAAVVLRDLEGLSTAEVAGALGSSETTVRSQISMARVKIRKFVNRGEKKSS
jgi:RNA polymerase sigma-70 factor (ECF subfamily)